MTAELVNLRLARKTKKRAAHAAAGDLNRAKHGRASSERDAARREAETATRRHDGHRLERLADPDDGNAA